MSVKIALEAVGLVGSATGILYVLYLSGCVQEIFWASCFVSVVLLLLCYIFPKFMQRLMSMPETFLIENNLGTNALALQSVTYAAYHVETFSQATHHTFLTDSVMWAGLIGKLCGPLGYVALIAWGFYQGRSFQETFFTRCLVGFWVLCCAAGHAVMTLENGVLVAQYIIVAGAIFKVVGHAVEPVPPGIVASTFMKITDVQIRNLPFLLAALASGVIAEFASGLPYRLPAIWLYLGLQMSTGWEPEEPPSDSDCDDADLISPISYKEACRQSEAARHNRRRSWEEVPSYEVAVANRPAFTGGAQVLAVIAMIVGTVNAIIAAEILQATSIPLDVYAGSFFIAAGITIVLLVDAQVFVSVFFPLVLPSETKSDHPLASLVPGGVQDVYIRVFAALNWMAGLGVCSSSVKLSVAQRLTNYDSIVFPTPQVICDLATGELEINAIVRQGSSAYWEAAYAHICVMYLYAVLSIFLIHRALRGRCALARIGYFNVCSLLMAAAGQYFVPRMLAYTAGLYLLNAAWMFCSTRLLSDTSDKVKQGEAVRIANMLGMGNLAVALVAFLTSQWYVTAAMVFAVPLLFAARSSTQPKVAD
jgi:hypothetical protein